MKDLQSRLVTRNQDHPDIIKKRLADAQETVSHVHEFDYVVINDDFAAAQHDLSTIIEASRLLCRRQTAKQMKLIADLVS